MVFFSVFLLLLSAIPKDIDYDPQIAEFINNVSTDSIASTISRLSGEQAVFIDNKADSIPCRYAYSSGAYKAMRWLAERFDTTLMKLKLTPFIPVEIRDVDILASGIGWACGFTGTWEGHKHGLIHTSNTGTSWEWVSGIKGYYWQAVKTISADSAWLVGSKGRIMRTVDGLNWKEMRSVNAGLYDIAALDSRTGWAVGNGGILLSTKNAWETYSEDTIVTDDLRYISVQSPNLAWIASNTKIWRTADAKTWQELSQPLSYISDMLFIDSLTGYLTGEVNSQGAVCITHDAGHSWHILTDTFSAKINAISVISPDTIIIAGSAGLLRKSTDGGIRWFRMHPPSLTTINDIAFAKDGQGLAVGDEDIFYSHNGLDWSRTDTSNLGLMWNIEATLPTEDNSSAVLITAHYDARGSDNFAYTPGADDNASGVATVIEAARILAPSSFRHPLKFVLFGGEEVGLWGSHRYLSEVNGSSQKIMAVLNADMFAYDSDSNRVLEINSNIHDPMSLAAGKLMLEVINLYSIKVSPEHHTTDACDKSDHYYFWKNRLPAIFITEDRTDFNPFNHSAADRISSINIGYLKEGVKAAVGWLASMAKETKLIAIDESPSISQAPVIEIKISSDILSSKGWLELAPLPPPVTPPVTPPATQPVTQSITQTPSCATPAISITHKSPLNELSFSLPSLLTPCIYEVSGRKVKTLAGFNPQSRLYFSVDDLASGVYWIGINLPYGKLTKRFIVVR